MRSPQQALGGRTEQPFLEPPEPLGTDNNKVGAFGLCGFNDGRCGISDRQGGGRAAEPLRAGRRVAGIGRWTLAAVVLWLAPDNR